MMSWGHERVNKVLRRGSCCCFCFFSPLFIPYFVMVFLGGGGRTMVDGYMGPSIPKGQRIPSHPG
jgi:hypothetical protein